LSAGLFAGGKSNSRGAWNSVNASLKVLFCGGACQLVA
jgi:hypothetical protein